VSAAHQLELDKILEEQYRRKLQANFGVFVRQAWQVLHPFEPLHDGWYIDALAEWAQATASGKITRLIVNQPPRTLKSTIFTVMFPCWMWTTQPEKKFIFYSWSFDKLSVPLSVDRRHLILSQWYQDLWGHKFRLSYDENMKWMFSNDQTGRMTVLTGATGIGGNFLIIDDPHNTEQAESEAERTSCVRMVRQGLMTRLDNPQSDSVIVVMQRLHDEDVAGAFLKDGGWKHLCLPAKAEHEHQVTSPRTGRLIHQRLVGDHLDPVRLSDEVLAQKKVELGSKGFAGQYQQEPAPPSGNIFDPAWWKMYDPNKMPIFEECVVTVDAAFKETKNSSDVAIQKWGNIGVHSYLINRDTRKMGFAATKAAIRAMMNCEPKAEILLIEDKANGPAIIEELQTEFFVIPINPGDKDKVARAEACSPMVEAGTAHLPQNADGVKIQTLAAKFPNSDKDDVDAMTQYLNWRRKRGAAMKWFEDMAKRSKEKQAEGPEEPGVEVQRIDHPTPQEVHRLAMEQSGMKTTKHRGLNKPAKAAELKKEDSNGSVTAAASPTAPPDCCPDCNSTAIFKSAKGRKCLNPQCGKVFPNPTREVNIG